jgi:hypothetical protein
MNDLKVRIATHPFMGKVGILHKSGRLIVLENTNIILIAKWFKFYPVS